MKRKKQKWLMWYFFTETRHFQGKEWKSASCFWGSRLWLERPHRQTLTEPSHEQWITLSTDHDQTQRKRKAGHERIRILYNGCKDRNSKYIAQEHSMPCQLVANSQFVQQHHYNAVMRIYLNECRDFIYHLGLCNMK